MLRGGRARRGEHAPPLTRVGGAGRLLALRVGPRFRLPDLPGDPLPRRVVTSTYYDTAGLVLARAGVALRRTLERRRACWWLTLPRGAARLELTLAGRSGAPPAEALDLVTAYTRGRVVGPVATLRARRAGLRVRGLDGPTADVVVDAIAVLDGRQVIRRLRTVEVALLGGDEAALARIETALRAAGAADDDGRALVLQALELAPTPPAPRTAPAAPAAEHLAGMIGAHLGTLLAHDPGVRLGRDPEELHHMRVAVRRIRALLRAARPMLSPDWVEPLRAELAWLGDVLGAVRDLDVLLGHLADTVLERTERRAFARLLGRLEAERAAARVTLLEGLRSERYIRLLDRLEDAAREPRVAAPAVSLAELAAREFRQLRRAMRELGERPTDAELHAVRIRGKRSRYAAELAEPAVGKPATRFIRKAQVLQDVLGEHQDAVVAEERLRRLVAGARGRWAAFAAGRLAERQRARREAARAALPAAWAKVEKRGRDAWP